MRSTHKALLTSLMGYNFAATGGGVLYGTQTNRVDTQLVNIAARRISDAHCSSRLKGLMPIANLTLARNHYVQQRGSFLERDLRAHRSALELWLQPLINKLYGVENWTRVEHGLHANHGRVWSMDTCGHTCGLHVWTSRVDLTWKLYGLHVWSMDTYGAWTRVEHGLHH